LNYRVSLDLIK